MEGITYILTLNNSPVFYIGSTSNLKKRRLQHLRHLQKNIHHNVSLQKAWNNSESTDVRVGVMFSGTIEEARKHETDEIRDRLGNPNMVNIGLQACGGDNYSRHPELENLLILKKKAMRKYFDNLSEEKREQLRERNRGHNNPMYGKRHTDEVKQRISKHHQGHSYNKGNKLSPEHVRKISERQKLRIGPKNSFYGKKHSPETVNKLRQSQLGKKPVNSNIIEIDSVQYKSQADAAKALNVCEGTIVFRLRSKSPRFSGYRLLKHWAASNES